ncbi:MAG TPA: sigma-70 family RNA polymerase sigma factor [Thermoanaerobaculia bacterium]
MSRTASTPESEAALLRRIAAKDRRAFEALYHAYYRRLFAYLFKTVRRPELAEEVLDDVMLAIWTGAAGFDGRSRPSTWIFGIAYHKALKAMARQDRHKAETEESDGDALMTPMTEEGPEGLLARREMADVLERALRALPLEQRTVVELTYYHGFAYQEIADIMGCPVNTVKTRMFHARRRLRELLPGLGVSRAV